MVIKRSKLSLCLAVVMATVFLLMINVGLAAANDLNTTPPVKKNAFRALMTQLSSSGVTVLNPDGSYTYTQTVDENSTSPYYSPPANGGGFGIYSWYNQDYGWMHDFPDWNTPGLTIQSANLKVVAWDVDSEVYHGPDGEYDGVSIDGVMLNPGYLQGFTDQWSETIFDVPVGSVLDDGNLNVFLNIDMNHNYQNWATELDYSLLTITYRLDGNNPPYKPALSITPSGTVADDNGLTVDVVGPTPADPDGDAVHYEYRWFVDVGNGFFVDDEFAGRGNHTGNTVPASDTQVGDTWRVQVTPIDEPGAIGPFAEATWGTVIEQQKVWVIYAYKQLDLGNDWTCDQSFENITQLTSDNASTTITYEDTNGDGKNDKAVISVQNGFPTYYNSVTLDVLNVGTVPISISDIKIINNDPASLDIKLLESPSTTIKPNRKRAIGIDFRVVDGAPGNFSFSFSL